MTCNEEKISAYLDGELENAREVEAHLESCDACRETLRRWKALDRSMQGPVAPERWPEIRASILRRARTPLRLPLAVAASLIAAIVTAVILIPRESEPAPIVLSREPDKMLVAGEAALYRIMQAQPREIATLKKAISETETAEWLSQCETEYASEPRVAEGFRVLRTVFTRVSHIPEPAPSWEVREVQNAIQDADAIARVCRARDCLVSRSKP